MKDNDTLFGILIAVGSIAGFLMCWLVMGIHIGI